MGGKMNTQDTLIKLRTSTGMTRKEFCQYFGIPYRTLQDWELGNRTMPDYLLRLMIYKIKIEQLRNQDPTSDSGFIKKKNMMLSRQNTTSSNH